MILATDDEAAALKYLSGRFDEAYIDSSGELQVGGLAFVPERSRLEPMSNTILDQLMPETRFFRTELLNNAHNFGTVPVAVSVRRVDGAYDVRSYVSPAFQGDTHNKFLAQFEGIRTSSPEDREAFSLAIGALLASLMSGRVSDGHFDDNRYTMELWWGFGHYGDLQVSFQSNGIVESVYGFTPVPKPK